MPRIVSPLGVVVNVSDEKAARLGSGWAVAPAPKRKPAVARKAQSEKSDK